MTQHWLASEQRLNNAGSQILFPRRVAVRAPPTTAASEKERGKNEESVL
jgi:hypothetical protein